MSKFKIGNKVESQVTFKSGWCNCSLDQNKQYTIKESRVSSAKQMYGVEEVCEKPKHGTHALFYEEYFEFPNAMSVNIVLEKSINSVELTFKYTFCKSKSCGHSEQSHHNTNLICNVDDCPCCVYTPGTVISVTP